VSEREREKERELIKKMGFVCLGNFLLLLLLLLVVVFVDNTKGRSGEIIEISFKLIIMIRTIHCWLPLMIAISCLLLLLLLLLEQFAI